MNLDDFDAYMKARVRVLTDELLMDLWWRNLPATNPDDYAAVMAVMMIAWPGEWPETQGT